VAVADKITYMRRTAEGLVTTTNIAELLPDWRGADECWLFVSAHDDDIVIGAGLTFQVGIARQARVHAAITTDGRMGYCRPEQRATIAEFRRREAEKSFAILRLPPGNLRFLGYPDGGLSAVRGRYFSTVGSATEIAGADGLANAFSYVLRQVRPNRLFLATSTDLHPDHRIVHEELLISLFHARGAIWPELGEPLSELPKIYEFACYCDFAEPPQIRIETPPAMLDTKFAAIAAYASQEQIDMAVDVQRNIGPIEYLHELEFPVYSPERYDTLFRKEC
jgi:LmbE family N-acetylglucosaminyl deacetylase